MDEQLARSLVARYVEGWRDNNAPQILGTLTHDCLIIESHGPMYRGRDHVQRWITGWFGVGNSIERWDVTNFIYSDSTAAVEWTFEYRGNKGQSAFEGSSIVRFSEERITYLREYRCTKPPYFVDRNIEE